MHETFIIVHDQKKIIDFEDKKTFSQFPKFRYVFVGAGDISLIKNTNKVIIARNLPNNIEKYKYFVAYTAWYALVKNNLIETAFVTLLEYDIELSRDFYSKSLSKLKNNSDTIIGYVPYSMGSPYFLSKNKGADILVNSVNKVYKIDIKKIIKIYIKNTNDKTWPSTSNISMSNKNLTNFVKWFTPISLLIQDDKNCGHSFERAIKIYCILNKIQNYYISDVLKHQQLDSHCTQQNSLGTIKKYKLLSKIIFKLKNLLQIFKTFFYEKS